MDIFFTGAVDIMERYFFDKNGNIIDYYTIFNISYNAQLDDIKKAFRRLIKRYHPDTSTGTDNASSEKIDLIVQGYRILADEGLREEYNSRLFEKIRPDNEGHIILPNKRVKYSASLGEMLKARLLPKGIKRKDILYNFGQDIEIFVASHEVRRGAVAYIELPARMHCPLCAGQNPQCHVCNGIGRIATTSRLEVRIPPDVENGKLIDVDLMKIKPDRLTTFRAKSIRIRITIVDRAELT